MVNGAAKPVLNCMEPSAVVLYHHLQNRASFDRGYHKIDYRHSQTNPLKGKNDGKVVCEEIWETTLDTLDAWSAERGVDFHTLHKLIETEVKRPVPWLLETPYVEKEGKVAVRQPGVAQAVRKQIQKAIDVLKKSLEPLQKSDPNKYEEAFLIGLYAFVAAEEKDQKLSGADVENIPQEAKDFSELKPFFKYLAKEDGLGMWQEEMEDAPLEKTALETILGDIDPLGNLVLNGWCTEQSKVLYAVLRMAGFSAGFVEPRLTIDYFAKRRELPKDIPLQGHIASGVKVEIGGQTWIMDMAMKRVRADYAADHDYWELSLRQYWMVDLSNIGAGQSKAGQDEQAQASYEAALQMGLDSTAHYSLFNYFYILPSAGENISRFCKNSSDCLRRAFILHPDSPQVWYERGRTRKETGRYEKAIEAFLEAIDLDPRYSKAYEGMGEIFDRVATKNDKMADSLKKRIKNRMGKIYEKHPLLYNTIREQLKACSGRRKNSNSTIFFIQLSGL